MKEIWKRHPKLKRNHVYKFTTKEVSEKILSYGSVKIGALQKFRTYESLKLRDDSEGLNSAIHDGKQIQIRKISPMSVAGKMFCPEDPFDTSQNAPSIIGEVQVNEFFCFPTLCFTYSHDMEVQESLCDEKNKYDTCLRIKNLRQYCEVIAQYLSDGCKLNIGFFALPVIYKKTKRNFIDKSPSNMVRAFEKSQEFQVNQECRVVFALKPHSEYFVLQTHEQMSEDFKSKARKKITDKNINEVTLEIPELRKHVELINT